MNQEQIAGVLEGHPHWEWSIGDHAVICGGCHWTKRIPIEVSATDAFRAHQAAVLAPRTSTAQAEAWDAGHESGFWNGRLSQLTVPYDAPDPLIGKEHAKATNPYRTELDLLEAVADPAGRALVKAIHDRKARA